VLVIDIVNRNPSNVEKERKIGHDSSLGIAIKYSPGRQLFAVFYHMWQDMVGR
jgi:hypothetical protein